VSYVINSSMDDLPTLFKFIRDFMICFDTKSRIISAKAVLDQPTLFYFILDYRDVGEMWVRCG